MFLKMPCHEFTGISFGSDGIESIDLFPFFSPVNTAPLTTSLYSKYLNYNKFHLRVIVSQISARLHANWCPYSAGKKQVLTFCALHANDTVCVRSAVLVNMSLEKLSSLETVIRGSICEISNLSCSFSHFFPFFLPVSSSFSLFSPAILLLFTVNIYLTSCLSYDFLQ